MVSRSASIEGDIGANTATNPSRFAPQKALAAGFTDATARVMGGRESVSPPKSG